MVLFRYIYMGHGTTQNITLAYMGQGTIQKNDLEGTIKKNDELHRGMAPFKM